MDNSSKAKSVELLQTTIAQLQKILEQVNTASEEDLPNPAELENLLNSSQAIAQAIAPSTPPVKPENQPLVVDRPDEPETPVSQSRNYLVPGTIFAVVLIAVIVVLLKFIPPETITEPTEIVEKPPETTVTIPPKAEPVLPPSPPKLKIIPEQGLIAAIQTEVQEISDRYSEDLIRFVEADFLASLLTIQVGEDWYQLTPNQQQSMADQIFLRSQVLDFRKLELTDPEGVVLARSPVVGDSMVLLR